MTSRNSEGEEKLAPVSFMPWVNDTSDEPRTADLDETDLDAEAEFDRVDRIVVQSLRRRGLSAWEVTEILRQNDIPETDHAGWTERYEGLGYLDDVALAEQLVTTHHVRKGLGKSAVSQELKRRHIAPEIIEQALAGIDADDEIERAIEIAVKRAGQLASYDKETASRRLNAFLMRKGYSSSIVRQATDVAMAARTGHGAQGGAGSGTRSGVRFR